MRERERERERERDDTLSARNTNPHTRTWELYKATRQKEAAAELEKVSVV